MKFLALIEETFREARARKTLVGFMLFSTVVIVITFLVLQMEGVQALLDNPVVPPAEVKKEQGLEGIALTVIDMIWMVISGIMFFVTVAIGVFTTASFMTSMMEKGTIDLLLSKPVPRWMYIVGRYTGAILIIMLEVFYFMAGIWLAVGFSLGDWRPTLLVSASFIIIGFAGVYSLVTLVSVITKSSWFAIIVGVGAYLLSGMLIFGRFLDRLFTGEESGGVFGAISSVIYYLLPQTSELSNNMRFVITGLPIEWTPVFLTLLLSSAYLGLSCYLFSKKEF